jgi:DNA-binding PadR family transcriptional regulator
MQAVDERTGGVWRPSPGSTYPALSLLEDEGLVRVQEHGGGSGRTFELTDEGRAHLEEHADHIGDPFAAVAGEVPQSAREMRKVFGEIAEVALGRIAHKGTPEQVEQAAAILADTRRRLYLVLAGDE